MAKIKEKRRRYVWQLLYGPQWSIRNRYCFIGWTNLFLTPASEGNGKVVFSVVIVILLTVWGEGRLTPPPPPQHRTNLLIQPTPFVNFQSFFHNGLSVAKYDSRSFNVVMLFVEEPPPLTWTPKVTFTIILWQLCSAYPTKEIQYFLHSPHPNFLQNVGSTPVLVLVFEPSLPQS